MNGELAKAICEVMAQVSYVPETGRNTFHKYQYASDADLLGALQPVMAAAGLAMVPHKVETTTVEHSSDRKGKTQWRTELVVTWMLLHTSGDSIALQAPGCGIDGEDKGVYKAMTGALKYALRHLFLVPTGNNPEQHRRPEQQRRPEPARREPRPRPQPQQVPVARLPPAEWLLADLEGAGWPRATVVDELRGFVTFAMPKGKAWDPWAVTEQRQRRLVAWLAEPAQVEALERWVASKEETAAGEGS